MGIANVSVFIYFFSFMVSYRMKHSAIISIETCHNFLSAVRRVIFFSLNFFFFHSRSGVPIIEVLTKTCLGPHRYTFFFKFVQIERSKGKRKSHNRGKKKNYFAPRYVVRIEKQPSLSAPFPLTSF